MNVRIKVMNTNKKTTVFVIQLCICMCVCAYVCEKGKRPNEETRAVGDTQTQRQIGAKIYSQNCYWPFRGGMCAKKLSNNSKSV